MSRDDLISIARQAPFLITAADKTHRTLASELHEAGAWLVIHDPTELKEPLVSAIRQERVIVIRESMLAHLPGATYLPHPYRRLKFPGKQERKSAVSVSRVDFDKHTEMIIEANVNLREPIEIYGFLNTIYAHFKLEKVDADWRRNYRGTFAADDLWAAARIALHYRYVVDMSVIKGDGGGTQYTFLEAADAGCGLILNSGWQPKGMLADYAHTVDNSSELAEACSTNIPTRTKQAEALLQAHNATTISGHYADLLSR
jgi:hypothetical protein